MAKTFNFQEWLSTGGEESHRNFVLGASYERMCWVRACIDRIATSASSAPLLFYKGSLDKINDFDEKDIIKDKTHPVYKLFNPPKSNYITSFTQLMHRTFMHLNTDGCIYWVIEREKGIAANFDLRFKDELYPLVSRNDRNVLTRPKLLGWEGVDGKRYTTSDILLIPNYNPNYKDPLSVFTGLSPLSAARLSLESEYSIAGWNSAFFRSGMKNPLLLQAKGQLTREQKNEIKREVTNYYSGIDGAHGALLMQGGIEVKPLIVSPKDIDFINGKKLNREEILAIFGVPPSIVGIFEFSNYCLTGDALITLENGSTKPIIDIEPGDVVLSMGENSIVPAKVINCWEAGVKDIYEIKTSSRTLKCSPEHKFYRLSPGTNPAYPRKKEWIDAKDLSVGQYVAVVNGIPEFEGLELLPNGDVATEGGLHQLGLYLGDGCHSENGVVIAIPDTDEDKNSYIEEARQFWKTSRHFGHGRGNTVFVGRNKYTFSISSGLAAQWINDFGLDGDSHTKRIPNWIFDLTIPLKKAFLKGIFDSDGSYDKFGRVQIGLCNLELLNDIRDLCISVGYHVNNISSAMRKTNFGTYFIASIVVSFGNGCDMNFKNHPLPDGLVWQKIRSIKLLDQEPTYDLEIEGTHNFFANWMVVHNSNTREQIRIFWEHTLLPKMNFLLELIQFNILDKDFPGVSARWDLSKVKGLSPDPIELAAPAKTYQDMGYSASQIAKILNYPAMEPDKSFKKPAALTMPTPSGQPSVAPNGSDPKKPVTPGKPGKPGDPKPSDKPKPDNNNEFSEILTRKLKTYLENVNFEKSFTIFQLWEDLVEDFMKQYKATPEVLLALREIPQMLSSTPTVVMKRELEKNVDKIAALLCEALYNSKPIL